MSKVVEWSANCGHVLVRRPCRGRDPLADPQKPSET